MRHLLRVYRVLLLIINFANDLVLTGQLVEIAANTLGVPTVLDFSYHPINVQPLSKSNIDLCTRREELSHNEQVGIMFPSHL